MRKTVFVGPLVSLVLVLAVQGPHAGAAPASNDASGTIVIVFKDGHQQTIPVSAIREMQFKSAAGVATPIAIPTVFVPGRRSFLGKWIVGDGNGNDFTIVLEENGEATKSLGASHGTWTYVDGEARIRWDDGWHDVIRKTGSKHEKLAYAPGNSFSDPPSNVTAARNANPQPI